MFGMWEQTNIQRKAIQKWGELDYRRATPEIKIELELLGAVRL